MGTIRGKTSAKSTPGSFAPGRHDEPDGELDLEDDRYWDDWSDEDPFLYPGTKGSTFDEQVAFEAELAKKAGSDPMSDVSEESWTRFGSRIGEDAAADLFASSEGDLADAVSVWGDPSWDGALSESGNDPGLRRKLIAQGVRPADFWSQDRDRRMWACDRRGDLAFEGHLMSSAYDLSRHGVPAEPGRRILASPREVTYPDLASGPGSSGHASQRWAMLSTDDQINYISGYAAGAAAVAEARGRAFDAGTSDWKRVTLLDRGGEGVTSPTGRGLRFAGWRRAIDAALFADAVASGTATRDKVTVAYGDAVGGEVTLTHVEQDRVLGGFTGVVDRERPTQHRYDTSGSTVPWGGGQRVHFRIDQFLSSEPGTT